MPDLEQQLRDYGAFLDDLDAEPHALVAAPGRIPRRLIAAAAAVTLIVGSSVALAARGSKHRITVGAGGAAPTRTQPSSAETTATRAPADAILNAHPTFAEQVAQLEGWFKDALADAPGGRPILVSEVEVCDYRAEPSLGSNVQIGFASYAPFSLAQPLTEARLVAGCLARDDIPSGTSPTHQLCASELRGPIYDPGAVVTKPPTKPVVVFGNADCATAGYESFPSGLLAELNSRRRVEIEMWAVPRSCPTEQEATLWVGKVSAQELGRAWAVTKLPPPSIGVTSGTRPPTPPIPLNCVRPQRIDWDLQRVTLERF